ncbi:MAG: hypothetical protein WD315_00585 [Balneolaceae bacterium]
MKLTTSELEILDVMIYPEPFHQLMDETGMDPGSLRDDLIHLVSHGYVEVYLKDGSRSVSPFYDIDNLHKFAFKATRSGLTALQRR